MALSVALFVAWWAIDRKLRRFAGEVDVSEAFEASFGLVNVQVTCQTSELLEFVTRGHKRVRPVIGIGEVREDSVDQLRCWRQSFAGAHVEP